MNADQKKQFEEMQRKLEAFDEMKGQFEEIYDYVQRQKNGLIPLNDNQRVANGLGFIGRTSDTTPAGSLLVNTPEGPKKVLIA